MEPLHDGLKDNLIFKTIQQRKNGTKYDVEIRMQNIEIEGNKQYVVIAHDVSEREKAQL